MKTDSRWNSLLRVSLRVMILVVILVTSAWLAPLHADDDEDFVVDQVSLS